MRLLDGFTTLEEEQAYIEQIRKMPLSEKIARASRLTQEAMDAVKAEILREYPDVSEEERKMIFVERYYGKDLADRVRAYLAKRSSIE